jgi:hypothetical protein
LFGPALPEPFVKGQLETLLARRGLLPRLKAGEAKSLQERWEVVRRRLRMLGGQGGAIRVAQHVLEPLASELGYASCTREPAVATREGEEDGGWLMRTGDGAATGAATGAAVLRGWAVAVGTDLDAPNRRGRAYRFSPSRVAQRVLLARGERLGLLTDGEELRLLICDPARPDSHVAIRLDRAGGWRARAQVPDSYRLLLALAGPAGVAALPDITEEARLAQTGVTRKLRQQARAAVERFVQAVLDDPRNADLLAAHRDDPTALARRLWHEGLILVYRLLFVFKLESSADPARAFSFAATSLWRQTYSPAVALARVARRVLDAGADTGALLSGGLRALFRLFSDGLSSSELEVKPLGGLLFGAQTTPLLDSLAWSEQAVALLLDHLLWTPGGGKAERERVHYGALDVEDLGRVYEALLELEPGIAAEPMCRLRRRKLEVVLPLAQGEPYRDRVAAADADAGDGGDDEEDEDAAPKKGTAVQWIEEIPAGRFFLRVGLGRKSSGAYYTPHAFVRFLVQETLGPQVAAASPPGDPQPAAILRLRVLDPAMGSGHFLVEACRYLGDALYEACRLCDERALDAEARAERAADDAQRREHLARAAELRARVEALPDPDDELVAYLPSRVPEGEESGLSQRKAEAICRRLVAVCCLYGVDKNPLAVELAKLSLWLESYAEGLPLTFLDHRLVCGDSITGPFSEHLTTYPRSGKPIEGLFAQRLGERFAESLAGALRHVAELEASVGKDAADIEQKRAAKERLDAALAPFRVLAAAWSGGVMLGEAGSDADYEALLKAVADGEAIDAVTARSALAQMVDLGRAGLAYDLAFPEVFHSDGGAQRTGGFSAVLGNPPWDALQPLAKEFFASFDLRILDAPTRRERKSVESRLVADAAVQTAYAAYEADFERKKALFGRLYERVGLEAEGKSSGAVTDHWQVFAERGARLLGEAACVGWLLPSGFHANQSATGIRELYLTEAALRCCYSFENRKKLFEIHRSFKFATVVARRDAMGTGEFPCAFYLTDLDWLFGSGERLRYTLDFVRDTGGAYLTFLELRAPEDVPVARQLFSNATLAGDVLDSLGIRCGEELHMSKASSRFTGIDDVLPPDLDPRDPAVARDLLARGYLTLHEGKTFHQFDDRWGDRPRYLVHLDQLADKPAWRAAARYYRLAFRDIASSTNERTGIFAVLPPGNVCGNKAPCERSPNERPSKSALLLVALSNAFAFDYVLRMKVQATVNLFILNGCPVPKLDAQLERFLAHAALRLSCNHAGYAALWAEQLGGEWREAAPRHTWPVLGDERARWAVRAAVDAVVARAYGLERAQYEHVLSSFSHTSYPQAPALCLAAYDELAAVGVDAFLRRHDPYHDVPLNESLPRPAIDLPGAAGAGGGAGRRLVERSGQMQLLPADHGPLFRTAARAQPGPPPAAVDASDKYQVLVRLFEEMEAITSGDAQRATGLGAAAVRPLLQRLVEEGRAVPEGARRGRRYRRAAQRG